MKKKSLLMLLMWLLTTTVSAQVNLNKVVKNSAKKAERKIENRVEKRLDKGVDKALDTTEDGIDGAVKAENRNKKSSDKVSNGTTDAPKNADAEATSAENSSEEEASKPILSWARYDFVPGTEIIFEDNQENETNGEFPSKWDLVKGTIENAVFDGQNVIYFRETGNAPNGIIPLIENRKEDYLPDEFTLEFDAFFEANKYNRSYIVYFYDAKNQKRTLKTLKINVNEADYTGVAKKQFPETERPNIDKTNKWRHVAISFNKRALKVYLDNARLINIPNVEEDPTGITLSAYNHSDGMYFIKNIRLSKGAVPLYDKLLTDGKFITTGIKFEVNKADLKPESMGTINYVVKMMADHPELKFRVEGHTDSDGDESLNQKLSEARAETVKAKLIELGIESQRLTSKGFGENQPLSSNTTSEGKARNRRVEFVKW